MRLRPAFVAIAAVGLAAWAWVATASTPAAALPSEPSPRCPDDASWNDPTPPLNVFGNTWYVGTCGISALLITGDDGHVLIDGATPDAGPMIVQSIRTLGFDPRDVRVLLNTHEHVDHAGGLAAIQQATGAPLRARAPGLIALRKGDMDLRDPQVPFRMPGFPPVPVIEALEDDAVVRVGELAIQTHATPGHSLGGTSFTWTSCEAEVCRAMAYADSLSAVAPDSYRFSDPMNSPAFVPLLRKTFETVAALPCDILVSPHPTASRLWYRLGDFPSEPLVDAGACRRYADAARQRLDTRLENEQAANVRP
jgi:metallo-beta-lactamase class B